jgi:hypothetical protein
MLKVCGSDEWTLNLIRALGEDPSKTKNITINIPVREAVTMTVEKYVDGSTDGATEIIKKVAWIDPEKEN